MNSKETESKLAEGGADRITAKRIAGHITDKMWSKYSQVRFDSVREKMMEVFTPYSERKEDRVPVGPSVRELNPLPRPKISKAQVVPAANSQQTGVSSSFTFAGGFYVTGNTW